MSLGYIAALKELAPQTYQPLMLVEIDFKNKLPLAITGATNATPIVVTISNHPYSTGSIVNIQGVLGNTAANGVWTVTKIGANTFSLNGSVGNGSYVSGGQSQNSTMLFLSSHMLSGTAEGAGGFAYLGRDYLPRLTNTEQSAMQALSDQGIDRMPQVTVTIKDPSRTIYSSFESAIGFKGAVMTVRFVMWQAGTANFSTDSYVPFVGICQQASAPDDYTVQVTAVSKFQMTQTPLPAVHVQPTCPWSFPSNPEQRQDGKDNQFSQYYECGYSPDTHGANPAGNYQATTSTTGSFSGVQTSLSMNSVVGTLPATPFIAIIDGFGLGPANEVILVTTVAGSTWTVVRGVQRSYSVAYPSSRNVWVPYTTCNKTRASCMQRLGDSTVTSFSADGDIAHDKVGVSTGRFGGVQWQPAASIVSRGYISGKWELVVNNSNQAKYGDLVPLAYGTTWVNALILNVVGDANFTKMEVLVCYGQIPYVYDVVVNGVRIPHTYNDTHLSVPNELPFETFGGGYNIGGGFWQTINDGRRNGNLNADTLFDKKGDPYGSLAVLEIVVPAQLASASSTPSVQIRFDGPALRVYSNVNTFSAVYTDNPAWVMMDLLFWSGWTPTEMNIQSFIDAAAWFDTQINFTNKAGSVVNTIMSDRPGTGLVPYKRNAVSIGQRQRISAADLLRGVRNNCRCSIILNAAGLLTLIPRATLADQQSATATLNSQVATNDVVAVSSVHATGSAGNGYVAYAFDERSIAYKEGTQTKESTFRILTRTLTDSPNNISVTFEDAENHYNSDGLTVIDTEDTGRIEGQLINGNFAAAGLNTFDRAQRAINTFMSEGLRGNPRSSSDGQTIGDTGGTVKIEFETSFRGIHLKVGDIIMVSNQMYGISQWLFRITSVQPGMNARRIKIQASYHNDAWYLDTYGQTGAPKYQRPQTPNRLPFSWAPDAEAPMPGHSMYYPTDLSFQLSQIYSVAADNTAIVNMQVAGRVPVNSSSSSPQPPVIAMQATTATTGGTIRGGRTYFLAVSAKDVTGSGYDPSMLSYRTALVFVPSGTNTNTITVNITYWDPAAAGYVVFAGTSAQRMTYQADADSLPSTITLTSFNEDSWGAPDQYFHNVRVYPRREFHAGVLGAGSLSATPTTISLAVLQNAGFTTNQFQDYDISLMGLVETPLAQTNFSTTGTVAVSTGSATVTGTGTNFTSAMIGATIEIETTIGGSPAHWGAHIQSVTDATHLIMSVTFQVFDPGSGLTYSVFNQAQTTTPAPNQFPLPLFTAKIASNTDHILTLAAGLDGNVPDPTTINRGDGTTGVLAGDVWVIRTRSTVGSDAGGNFLLDTNWVNNLCPLFDPITVSACTNANPGKITTAAAHGYTTGDIVYVQRMNGMTSFPQLCTITVTSSTQFTLGINTTSLGTYTGGGFVQKQDQGLKPTDEPGRNIRFIAGTARGTVVAIKSATNTKLYIDGDWPVVPDLTSRYIVEEAMPQAPTDSTSTANKDYTASVALQFDVSNYDQQQMSFHCVAMDAAGNESLHFNSPVRDCYVMGSPGNLAVSGGAAINVDGTLAIGSDLAPIFMLNTARLLKAARVDVKTAPVGADLTVEVVVSGTPVLTLVIPNGSTSAVATAAQLSAAGTLPNAVNVQIDLTTVGTTFPGADLTVSLFF